MRLLYEVPLPPQAVEVLTKVLAPFAAVITGLILHGMHGAFPSWVRSLLTSLAHRQPGESLWAKVAFAPTRTIASGVEWIYHRFHHHVSHAVALKSGPVADWMEGLDALYGLQATTQERHGAATAGAFEGLRYRVLPREIHKAVNPVALAAHRAGVLAGRSISLEIKDRRDIGRGIDRLKHRGRWPLAAGLLGIDILIRDHMRPEQKAIGKQLGKVAHHDLPGIRSRLKDLERGKVSNRSKTWKKVAALATTAGFAAALTRALAKKWPWTGCRNFKDVSKLLRCSHFGFLKDLLELVVAGLVLRDLCRMVTYIESAAIRAQPFITRLVLEIEGFICGGSASLPSGIVASDRRRVAARPSAL